MPELKPRVLKHYKKRNGQEPFAEWLRNLDDKKTLKQVLGRMERLKLGNLGAHRLLGPILFELKFRSGIRIYCANIEDNIILILCTGDKNTAGEQSRDIAQAKEYWMDFMEQEQEDQDADA